MQFKKWIINEVRMSDMLQHIDTDDAQYLNQFPNNRQAQALRIRYELLHQAVDKNGKIRHGWSDIQTILGMPINTGIKKWANKLRKQGINPATVPVIKQNDAYQSIHYWRGLTDARLNKRQDLPGDDEYVSRHLLKSPQSKPMVGKEYWRSETDWQTIKKQVVADVYDAVNQSLVALSNPKHSLHLNYPYWNTSEKRIELIQAGLKFLESHKETAPEWFDNKKTRMLILKNFYRSQFQNGLIGKRAIASSGLDIPSMLAQGWTHKEIADLIANKKYKQPIPMKIAV